MRPALSKMLAGFAGAAIEACTNLSCEFVPVNTFPWTQLAIVVVPPGRTTAPLVTPTAVGTLLSLMLLRTMDPARTPLLGSDVRKKIGVLVATASIIASAPTD